MGWKAQAIKVKPIKVFVSAKCSRSAKNRLIMHDSNDKCLIELAALAANLITNSKTTFSRQAVLRQSRAFSIVTYPF